MILRLTLLTLTLLSLLPSVPVLGASKGSIITYADFNNIRNVASSISHVYFATTEGITRYNKLEALWEEPLTSAEGIDNRDIQRIWVDQFDKKLYAATSSSYFEYDLLFDSWYPVSAVPSLDNENTHVRPDDIMYAPTGFNYSSDGHLIDPFGRDYLLNDVLDDHSGSLWIGTLGYGAAIAGTSSQVIDLLPYGLLQNPVNTIFNDKGTLYLSGYAANSFRTGVTIFYPDRNSFSYIESGVNTFFPADDIYCFESDSAHILVGTSRGLLYINRSSGQVERQVSRRSGLPDDPVLSLKRVGDSVFVGTSSGLALITGQADSIQVIWPREFLNAEIYDLETTDSSLWIASSNGAYQLIFAADRLQKFHDPHSIIFSRAFQVERYGSDLWLASDGGLLRLNLENGDTKPFSSLALGARRRPMAVNDQIAAVATDRGVTIIFLEKPRKNYEREFSVSDGLPSDRIYALLMDGDYLWIGSDRGLTRFFWNDPDRVY